MVTTQTIDLWLNNSQTPTTDLALALADEAPYFLLPRTLLLRRCPDLTYEQKNQIIGRLALDAPSITSLSLAADADLSQAFSHFHKPQPRPNTPSTTTAIDKFIATYGCEDPKEEELLTRLIFNPTPDYAQILAHEEETSLPDADQAPEGSQDSRINTFIIKSRAAGGQFPPTKPTPPPPTPKPTSAVSKPDTTTTTTDSLPSESLAQIYIRRGDYTRAYEIINHLNLNFPEKSIYFADQLRYLSKLIHIQKSNKPTEN